MTILETLVQLRDDLKTWVTNNLNALNSKIEEKTISIDSKLSSTSTNPVQNKVISAEINSLKNQEHFSGDYNDLKNAPNISEDSSGEMAIADESGNIIFKANAQGAHTTALTLSEGSITAENDDNLTIADENGNNIFKVDAEGTHTTALTLHDGIYVENDDNLTIADDDGNTIFKVDSEGLETTQVLANIVIVDDINVGEKLNNLFSGDYNDLTNKPTDLATETYVDEKASSVKDELSESILSQGEDFKIVDEDGNIAFQVDNESVKVGVLEVNGENVTENFAAVNKRIDDIKIPSINGLATETYVDEKVSGLVNAAPETLNTLDELAAALGDDANFAATVTEQIGVKTNTVDFNAHVNETDGKDNLHITAAERVNWNAKSDFDGNYNGLTNKPIDQSENPDSLTIVDNNNNIIMKVGKLNDSTNGLEVYDAIIDNNLEVNGVNVRDTLLILNNNKVDKETGKVLSTNDYTTTEKEKLAGIEANANKTVVDNTLNSTSTNPVQNKVIYEKLNELTGMAPVKYPVTSVNDKTGDVKLEYEDIENAPNIYEDASNELIIADPSGNIIFRSDNGGFSTTTLSATTVVANGVNIGETLANKVDKINGKGLSTNDFTTAYKDKLDKLEDVNVTNTLAATTKAYVTGTTSATTNTGTQVFDTGVYLDTTAGRLSVASLKLGNALLTYDAASDAIKITFPE